MPDETIAQEDQGVSPTIVMPFSDVTVRDGTDLVQATVDSSVTVGPNEPSGLVGITGVSDRLNMANRLYLPGGTDSHPTRRDRPKWGPSGTSDHPETLKALGRR